MMLWRCVHLAVFFLLPLGLNNFSFLQRKLTPTFRDCLHRIFTLCDLDGDGALNDAEISAFNKRTFDEVSGERISCVLFKQKKSFSRTFLLNLWSM